MSGALKPNTVYFAIRICDSLFFAVAFTTSAIYRFQTAGLDPLQLVLVGTALEISVFLFEIPTGVVADVYSRRLSIVVGYAMIGAGLILEGLFPVFGAILAAQIIWGTGYTFTSGALDAWLAGELGEDRLTQVYFRASQLSQIAALAGILLGVAIARIRLNWPFIVGGGGLMSLALFLQLFMPETHFAPPGGSQRRTWRSMVQTLRQGLAAFRGRPLLGTIMSISVVYGLYSEALDRLWQPHFLANFTLPRLGELDTIFWFGIISSATLLLTIAVTEGLRRQFPDIGHQSAVRLLFAMNVLTGVGLIIFGLASSFTLAIAAYGALAVSRQSSWPVFAAWINRGIPTKIRATVLSSIGQMDSFGQIMGGPLLGVVARQWGLRAAMVTAGLILSPAMALLGNAYGQGPDKVDGLQSSKA